MPADAKLLADLVRTDRHNHRPIAGDSGRGRGDQGAGPGPPESDLGAHPAHQRPALGVARVLPRGLEAFEDLADRDALAILGRAPTPADAGR